MKTYVWKNICQTIECKTSRRYPMPNNNGPNRVWSLEI